MEIPIGTGFYVSDSLPIAHQECVNMIPIKQEGPALSAVTMQGSSGITQLASSGDTSESTNRGAWDLAGIPYFVNGDKLYRLNRNVVVGVETFSLTELGTILGSGRVSMADNGNQLMILVPGGEGYVYTVSGGLVIITDPDFKSNGDPQYVVFVDGFFACSTDSKKWITSSINDGTAWSALDFGSAESDPDAIVAPVIYNNQVFMTGSETTEAFQNIGGSGFSFQRSNIFLDKGCYAPFTLIATNQRFFMVGGGKNEKAAVWSYQGGKFEKISTIVIDRIINAYPEESLAASFSLVWGNEGQYYVAFVFLDRAFVYNITTGLWHEQKSGIPNSVGDLQQTRWRVNSLVTAYGYVIAGDNQNGRIGRLDYSIYEEYENELISIFTTPPISNGGKPFRVPSIELTMEAGIGNSDVPNPVVSMVISKDMKTFAYERNRRIGPIGQYGRRTTWRKNGRFPRYGIFSFRLSDKIKRSVIKLEAQIS